MKLSSLSDENSAHQDKAQSKTITKYTTTAKQQKEDRETKKPQKELK
jgi:hypothetical protein